MSNNLKCLFLKSWLVVDLISVSWLAFVFNFCNFLSQKEELGSPPTRVPTFSRTLPTIMKLFSIRYGTYLDVHYKSFKTKFLF